MLEQRPINVKLQHPNLLAAFNVNAVSFGPNDFYLALVDMLNMESPTFNETINFLVLANWDPAMFFQFRQHLQVNFTALNFDVQQQLLRGLHQVELQYFPLDTRKDIPFELGLVYSNIGNPEKSIKLYMQSLEQGTHHVAIYQNLGLAHAEMAELAASKSEKLDHFEKSMNFYIKALKIDPSYVPSLAGLKELDLKMKFV